VKGGYFKNRPRESDEDNQNDEKIQRNITVRYNIVHRCKNSLSCHGAITQLYNIHVTPCHPRMFCIVTCCFLSCSSSHRPHVSEAGGYTVRRAVLCKSYFMLSRALVSSFNIVRATVAGWRHWRSLCDCLIHLDTNTLHIYVLYNRDVMVDEASLLMYTSYSCPVAS